MAVGCEVGHVCVLNSRVVMVRREGGRVHGGMREGTQKDGGKVVVEGTRGFLSAMASAACNSARTFRAVVGTNTASS